MTMMFFLLSGLLCALVSFLLLDGKITKGEIVAIGFLTIFFPLAWMMLLFTLVRKS